MSSLGPVNVVPAVAGGHFSQATVRWFAAQAPELSRIRAHLRETLARWDIRAAIGEPAEVLLTELCTNVIRHTDSSAIGVRLESTPGGGLHVAVQQSDPDPVSGFALARPAAPADALGGRGLHIVDSLASAWGTYRVRQTTTTWFELRPDDARPTAPGRGDLGRGPSELIGSLHAAVHRSQLLLRITEALSSASDRTTIADAITRTLRGPLGAMFTGIAAIGEDGRLHYVSLEPLPADTATIWAAFPLEWRAPVAAAARENTAYFHASRAEAEAQFPGIGAHMQTAGTSAMAHLPLTARGTTFGTLAVSWEQEHEFDADTRALLLIVAGYTAQALARQ